jgi:hypothetical protein
LLGDDRNIEGCTTPAQEDLRATAAKTAFHATFMENLVEKYGTLQACP